MLPQSLTLILILLVAAVVCCLSAKLPGNAYLPPPASPPLSIAADESLLSALNGFLIFDNSQDPQDSQNSYARYAPVFVDYPGVPQLLRQQQEYALDLPFEGGGGNPRRENQPELDFGSLAKRSW